MNQFHSWDEVKNVLTHIFRVLKSTKAPITFLNIRSGELAWPKLNAEKPQAPAIQGH